MGSSEFLEAEIDRKWAWKKGRREQGQNGTEKKSWGDAQWDLI